MTRKAVKGSVIADHLADHAMENYEPLNFDLPDEDVIVIENGGWESNTWTLYFDGAVNVSGNGAGAVVISQKISSILFQQGYCLNVPIIWPSMKPALLAWKRL
jgi:hypothetical protein